MHELSDAELEREIRGYFSPDAQAQAAEALERRFAELEKREAELTRREEALAEQERRYAEQERAREAAQDEGKPKPTKGSSDEHEPARGLVREPPPGRRAGGRFRRQPAAPHPLAPASPAFVSSSRAALEARRSRVRGFQLWVVADVLEAVEPRVREAMAQVLGHVGARYRVDHPPHEAQRGTAVCSSAPSQRAWWRRRSSM